MSRVVIISQLPPPIHGSTMMTKAFVQTLDELGCEWRMVDRRFSTSVAQVGKFSFRKLGSAALMPVRLLRDLLTFRPDVVVFFATNRAFSFTVDWLLSEVMRLFPASRINYLHTVGFESLAKRNSATRWMVGRLLGSAHRTVCLGPTLANDVAEWVPSSSISFIPNTVVDRPDEGSKLHSGHPPLVLYLSNLIPEKGADDFVDVAIQLAGEMPDARFVVAGATTNQEFSDSLESKVKSVGLASRIQFPGSVTDQTEKWRLLRDATVLVFPSTYPFEAQPLTILEALSVGTPVVAYEIGGIADVVSHELMGRLVPAGDTTRLIECVREMLEASPEPTEVAELGQRFGGSRYRNLWSDQLHRVVLPEKAPRGTERDRGR